ncbi:MAG: OstA-like protein [Bacteroidota bacterium]
MKLLLGAFLIGLHSLMLSAQTTPVDTGGVEQIFIDNARFLDAFQNDPRGAVQRLIGEVELSQDSIFMYCDSAELINEQELFAFDNVIIQQGDSIAAFSDRLTYSAVEQIARLRGDVVLQNGQLELYTEALDYNLATKVAVYNTPGRVTNGETELSSLRGRYFANENLVIFQDSVVVIDERFEMRADSLHYNTTQEIVYFVGPTVIRSDSSQIYCEDGFYNVQTQTAEFRQNAQFVRGEQLAAADTIAFQGGEEEIYDLLGQAYFREGDQRLARGDRIRYNQTKDEYELEGNGLVIDGERTVRGEIIHYEVASGAYSVSGGRSTIVDGNNILEANEVNFDNATGLGLAEGAVIWRDTSANLTIESARAEYDQTTGYLKAIGGHEGRNDRPVLLTEMDGDTLWVVADTLLSYRQPVEPVTEASTDTLLLIDSTSQDTVLQDSLQRDTLTDPLRLSEDSLQRDTLLDLDTLSSDSLQPDSLFELDSLSEDSLSLDTMITDSLQFAPVEPVQPDSIQVVMAYNDVRMYKSDMQAVADSLFFNTTDSILTLFEDPILWQDTSQLLADTIDIYLRDQTLDKVHLKRNALVITSTDLLFFNQIKGRDIFAYFDSTELVRTDVDGNAEAIYYALDEEQAYIGVNQTACSRMILYFRDAAIRRIRFLTAPSGDFGPIVGGPATQPKLENFRWEEVQPLRPKSYADLFVPR